MLESKSSALTGLAIPLRNWLFVIVFSLLAASDAMTNEFFDYDCCK
jgi:hypothetical protein